MRGHSASQRRAAFARYLPIILTMMGGCAASLGAFWAVRDRDRHLLQQDFARRAEALAPVLHQEVSNRLDVLYDVAALFAAGQSVERAGFHAFLQDALDRNRSSLTIEWLPRVSAGGRPAFEARGQAELGPEFQIREHAPDGNPLPAAARAEYFPVWFMEPWDAHLPTIGFDAASDPIRRAAMEKACDRAEPVATPPLALGPQHHAGADRYIVYYPVFRSGVPHDTVTQRRATLVGFVSVIFNGRAVAERVLQQVRAQQVFFCLMDESDGACLFSGSTDDRGNAASAARLTPVTPPPASPVSWSTQLTVANRRWRILCQPTAAFFASHRPIAEWATLLGGLLLTALLAAVVVQTVGRGDQVRALVERRTRDLVDANRALAAEIAERTRAVAALRESEVRFRSLYEDLPLGLYRTTVDGRILLANPALVSTLGYDSFEDLAAQPLSGDNFHPDYSRADFAARLDQEGIVRGLEEVWRKKDGTDLSVRETARAVRGPDGQILYYEGTVEDFTVRLRAERALRASEERFRSFFENVPVGLYRSTPEGRILDVNPALVKMYGFPDREALLNANAASLYANPAERREWTERMARDGVVRNMELHLRRADGTPFLVRDSGYTVRGADGQILYYEGSEEDITDLRLAEVEVRRSQEQYAGLVNTLEGIVWEADADTFQFTFVSPQAERLLGYPVGRWLTEPTFWADHLHPDDRQWAVNFCVQATSEGRPHAFEYRFLAADGRVVWLHDLVTVVIEDGKPRRLRGVMMDVTDRVRTQEALRVSEERYRLLAGNVSDVIWTLDLDLRFTYMSPSVRILRGYTVEEAVAQSLDQVMTPASYQFAMEVLTEELTVEQTDTLDLHRSRTLDLELTCKDGTTVWTEVKSTFLRDASGRAVGLVGVARDITERRLTEARLQHLAFHDPLTGLPNRTLALDRVEQALARARWNQRVVALLFLDLDHFKLINDTLGHTYGDLLLNAVSQRLQARLRPGDTIARLGGDEFVLLLMDVAHADDVTTVAQEVLASFRDKFQLNGHEVFVSTSIGISLFPGDGADAETLLKNADTAMYRAKEEGRNTFQFFTADMNARVLHRLEMELGLRKALEREEFLLHYQPIVTFATGQISGVEALVRWQHPERGIVPPNDFIPVAEETGLIVPIGDWVLRTACAQNKAWQDAGLPPVRIAVNLSARQFNQTDLAATVRRALDETGLAPEWLELELTENILMQNAEASLATLERLHAMGVVLSIDDFGSGHSSFGYLKHFPIRTVKVDRDFVQHIATDADDAAIVSAIIAMAHRLKLKVVAEGVETEEQLFYLRSLRCDRLQGFLFSRPLPAEDFARLMESGAVLAAATSVNGNGSGKTNGKGNGHGKGNGKGNGKPTRPGNGHRHTPQRPPIA